MRNIFTSTDDVFTSLLCSMATGERRLVTDDRGNKTPGGTRGGLAPDRGHNIGR